MKLPELNRNWTLFLDRDGVINQRKYGSYITHPNEFSFIEGVPEALAGLSKIFSYLVVVTNQQGIGKGIMTENDLKAVHTWMLNEVASAGGRIDGVFHCPNLESDNAPCRKPNTGMAMDARNAMPGIRFRYSVMVGDSHTDMVFARRLGMLAVLVGEHESVTSQTPYDAKYDNLHSFYADVSGGNHGVG